MFSNEVITILPAFTPVEGAAYSSTDLGDSCYLCDQIALSINKGQLAAIRFKMAATGKFLYTKMIIVFLKMS